MAGLFHDPSIGNPIHITIVRLILLEDEEVSGLVPTPPPGGVGCRSPLPPDSRRLVCEAE